VGRHNRRARGAPTTDADAGQRSPSFITGHLPGPPPPQLSNIKIIADNIGTATAGGAPADGRSAAERKELHDLRRKLKKIKAGEAGGREEAGKYRSENLALKEEVGKLKIKLLSSGGGGGGEGAGEVVTETGNAALRAQLRESETKNTKLTSQNIQLTQELEDYKLHMKKTTRAFKAEIAGLKQGE
jgi:hypothetical protein